MKSLLDKPVACAVKIGETILFSSDSVLTSYSRSASAQYRL